MALAAALAGSGQSCFRVVEAGTGKPVAYCTVRCVGGSHGIGLLGAADSTGKVCSLSLSPVLCERIEIRSDHHRARRIDLAEALAGGEVELERDVTELEPAVVEAWPRKRDRQALAAAGTADSTLLQGFERSSLRSAAQWIPGVQWDERGHGGSLRLSIRGSLLRSPYGVRGVKVYWGPFPLTLADGSTPLELLDPLLTGSVDIVRSVGSPAYGSAPSGLLLGNASFRAANGSDASLEATGGSYGYYRLGALARTTQGPTTLTAGLVHQRNDGYREQEWSARDQAFINSRFRHKKSTTQIFLTWQNASWALPGSVDATTAEEDPRAARPYSELVDAHLEKEQFMGGLANEMRLGEHLRVRSSVHGQMIDKTNPYGTTAVNCGYKEETVRAVGARLSLSGDRVFALPTAWDFGMEALSERDHLRELHYEDAVPGDIKVNGDTRVANLNGFLTTVTRLGRNTTLHAGAGMERTNYHHEDHVAGMVSERTTTPALLPYAGLEQRLRGGFGLHLRYAESLSRATVWELLGSSGTFNEQLRGEHVREWEFGVSNEQADAPVRADFNVFHRTVDDLITQVQDGEGASHFENEDQALIAGFELLVRGPVHRAGDQRVDLLGSCAITATDLRQQSAPTGEPNSGDIPGIPLLTAGLIARSQGIGLKVLGLEAGARLIGSMSTGGGPATDDEHVEHVRVSYLMRFRTSDLSMFLHCENLFDARYSSWIQVNDPGGRYYNPAPGRSFFFGARMTIISAPRKQAD